MQRALMSKMNQNPDKFREAFWSNEVSMFAFFLKDKMDFLAHFKLKDQNYVIIDKIKKEGI